ncbi:AEC family transporter [Methylopila turkensis]|uniref:Transporter n=1 Tax=Methylopila turkensis TaxID=1437816 RepID=A0A9W6JQV8_9HYPH|nr:AEC family transporter [Methylopila turkensis]GLK81602.1 transporter [Methylopila turkensis]
MSQLIAIVLPTFGLIALGFIAAHLKLLGDRAGDGLSDYVFLIAVPALIFRTLVGGGPIGDNPWGYWVAYFAGVAVVWTLGMLFATRLFGRDRREAAIHGFASGQSNTVLVGVPLILQAYGDAGATPLFLLLAIHLPIMMSTAALLIEAASSEGRKLKIATGLARTIVTHPIILALAAGVAAKSAGVQPTGAALSIVDQLAATASPCALVAMGVALKRYGMLSDRLPVLAISGLKLVLHPFLVWVLAVHILPVPPVWAGVAVLFAAMPCGINAYLVAARYKVGERTASAAVAVSTALSVVTVSGWLWVLGLV